MAEFNRLTRRRVGFVATVAGLALATATAADAQSARTDNAPDPSLATRPLTIVPRVGVQGLVTDNVNLTASDHETDFLTQVYGGLSVAASGPRLNGSLDAQVTYDSYARAHQLNGFSYAGYGSGTYNLVDRLLTLEADGSVVNGNVSAFGGTAIDRTGIEGRTQVTNLAFGPRLTTTVGDYLDLTGVARVRWVGYQAGDSSNVFSELPPNSTIRDVTVSTTTGERYATHEITAAALYQADNHDFRIYSAMGSVFVGPATGLRAFVRGGVDDIRQPAVIDLQAPIWSVGLEYHLNARSYARIEGGRRYHDNNLAAESLIDLTDRFYMTASYRERILPAQISLNEDFLSFLDTSALPPPLVENQFGIIGNLNNETSKDKIGDIRAVYVWPDQQLSIGATWLGRRILSSNARDETLTVNVAYTRSIRPDLSGTATLDYGRVLDSRAFGSSRNLQGTARLTYRFTPTVEISGGYAYSNNKQTSFDGPRLVENVVFANILKRF